MAGPGGRPAARARSPGAAATQKQGGVAILPVAIRAAAACGWPLLSSHSCIRRHGTWREDYSTSSCKQQQGVRIAEPSGWPYMRRGLTQAPMDHQPHAAASRKACCQRSCAPKASCSLCARSWAARGAGSSSKMRPQGQSGGSGLLLGRKQAAELERADLRVELRAPLRPLRNRQRPPAPARSSGGYREHTYNKDLRVTRPRPSLGHPAPADRRRPIHRAATRPQLGPHPSIQLSYISGTNCVERLLSQTTPRPPRSNAIPRPRRGPSRTPTAHRIQQPHFHSQPAAHAAPRARRPPAAFL